MKTVIIIGAGVNGLAVAWAMREKGWGVTVLDKNPDTAPHVPSMLEYQIIRPHYGGHLGFASRFMDSLREWQRIFTLLGQEYYLPCGAIAISRRPGDWTDVSLKSMRDVSVPFRMIDPDEVASYFPAMRAAPMRYGILSDLGGIVYGRKLLEDMRSYLRQEGVYVLNACTARAVDHEKGIVQTSKGSFHADHVVITADHAELMTEHFHDVKTFVAGFMDLKPKRIMRTAWRYSPVWVELGLGQDLWGFAIPETDAKIRISSGGITQILKPGAMPQDPDSTRDKLIKSYSKVLNFEDFEEVGFQSLSYHGYEDGRMMMANQGRTFGILADSGHGFKFAAQNARFMSQALSDGYVAIAARRIAAMG